MLRDVLQRLDERFPQLARWMGGRLDIELPAFMTSVVFHVCLLLALAMVGYGANAVVQRDITSTVVDTTVSTDLSRMAEFQDLDMSDKPPSLTPQAGSFAPNLSNTITAVAGSAANIEAVEGGKAAPVIKDLAIADVKRATDAIVPTAAMYGNMVSIKGNGAEHVGGVEGAVDRVANEILRRLEKGRVLAIWLFDASGSLVAERERLAKHIDTVYTHISQMDENNRATDGGLLTGVVAFGHDLKAMTPEPTADKGAVIQAIRDVPLDNTGVENTFGTVATVVRKWGKYKDANGNVYHPMVIIVTDEVGDDEARLEEAVEVAGKAKVPVYVLGSQALFGRTEGYMDYTDPKTKQTYHNLPVRQGPESVVIEQVRLPFWYGGGQFDMMDSGAGPWALSRLAVATGGTYFITRMGQSRMGFDPVLMHEYKPDWISRQQYEATVLNNRFRHAIIEAALITQQKLPGTPPLNFPPADTPEFKDAMRDGQVVVERTEYTIDEALGPISQREIVKLRDRETSRRWQANYDLTRGRLLAMKVRCHEYNWLCAKMKRDPMKFEKKDSNAWKLVPDPEIKSSQKAEAAAKQAKELLEHVLKEHPGTPWALFAQRELKDPFGFKWVETHVPPLNKGKEGDAEEQKKKKKENMPKPPPPPKL